MSNWFLKVMVEFKFCLRFIYFEIKRKEREDYIVWIVF